MKIYEFKYDGFGGTCNEDRIMDYDVEPIAWSRDPGIFLAKCSDGYQRFIPTYAIVGGKPKEWPEQDLTDAIMFGCPSSSEIPNYQVMEGYLDDKQSIASN